VLHRALPSPTPQNIREKEAAYKKKKEGTKEKRARNRKK
jgi:hypothetical protein